MTIETVVNKTIQSGNGSNKDFDFSFEIPDEDSLSLTKRGSDGTETAITTNFTVTGIGDEAGGTVNYPTSGSALTSSEKIIIKRVISLKQLENLRNQGDYSLEDIEDALDRAVMMCQQLQEQIDRCLKLNLTSSSTYVNVDDFVANRLLVVSSDGQSIEMSSAEYGSIDAYLSTLVAIAADISTVAGIAADVTTVAGISSSIPSVVANMTSIQNAASFGFPTLASGDEYKMLQIKADRTGYNAVEAVSRRNAIINGGFDVWQRGTSFTSIASAAYFADRFFYQKVGAMVHDISRSTNVPTVAQAGRLFNYSALVDCQTVDSSIASTDVCLIAQRIEGFNWLPLAQKTITLSFWVKATKTGIYCVALRNNLAGTPDRSYVAEYNVNAADTWEYKTITITASPSAGTWDYTTSTGVELAFVLACGSTYQTTAGAWQTGNYVATSNQVNACDSTSNNFRLASVQLEVGSLPTPFEHLPFQQQLLLCQRYYQKSYNYAIDPATVATAGYDSAWAINTLDLYDYGGKTFRQQMRAAPTLTIYNPATGTSGQVRDLSSSTNKTAAPGNISERGYNMQVTSATPNNAYAWHWTANAEI